MSIWLVLQLFICGVTWAFKSLNVKSLKYQITRFFAYAIPSAWNVPVPKPLLSDSLIFPLKDNFFRGAFYKAPLCTPTVDVSSC